MFDFRYHALSLVAVFLALGIGIVLGVTIGDSLVSEADRGLRRTLRGDLLNARDSERRTRAELDKREDALEAAFPMIAANRLAGERVAIVAVGPLPDELEDGLRESVEEAGGTVDSVVELQAPPELERIGDELGGPFDGVEDNDTQAATLGEDVARSLVDGSAMVAQLEDALPDAFRGDFEGATAAVFWRDPADESSDAEEAFETALAEELVGAELATVGVERSDTEPSQIGWYSDHGLSSVDSVDVAGGRAALVLALDGEEGRFGFKDSAEEPLPSDG